MSWVPDWHVWNVQFDRIPPVLVAGLEGDVMLHICIVMSGNNLELVHIIICAGDATGEC